MSRIKTLALLLGMSVGLLGPVSALAEEEIAIQQPDSEDSQEIGVLGGVAIGGGTTPGGLSLEGRYLYRASEEDWFEIGIGFALGSGDAECFRDRDSAFLCEHGLLDGFSAKASVGLRRYLVGQQQFRPYVRGGVGLHLVSFSADDVLGVATPLYLGGGIRAEVGHRVLVVADATLQGGPSFLNQNLGIDPNFALTIGAGVEITLESSD